MLIQRKDLQEELKYLRGKNMREDSILAEVTAIFKAEEEKERDILERLQRSEGAGALPVQRFDIDLLDSDRIFHLSQIRRICIEYRLRYLPSAHYRGELPREALSEIKRLERMHGTSLQDFRILGPAEFFRLENADDPMLFTPLGNDFFYLIHKWGRDIHPLRKTLMWPLRSLENIVIFSFIISFLLSFGIRELFFSTYREDSQFLIIFLYCFKAVVGLTFFYGISLGKNVSSANWNSKFFNS